jgi:hypothetical protein
MLDAPDPKPINAVDSTASLLEHSIVSRTIGYPLPKVWTQSYVERTKEHGGLYYVDVHSLYEATTIPGRRHLLDQNPWKTRLVKQCFLHEQSLALRRNGFSNLSDQNGNVEIKQPVCKATSIKMPMKADEWTEEWYRTLALIFRARGRLEWNFQA